MGVLESHTSGTDTTGGFSIVSGGSSKTGIYTI